MNLWCSKIWHCLSRIFVQNINFQPRILWFIYLQARVGRNVEILTQKWEILILSFLKYARPLWRYLPFVLIGAKSSIWTRVGILSDLTWTFLLGTKTSIVCESARQLFFLQSGKIPIICSDIKIKSNFRRSLTIRLISAFTFQNG